MSPFDMYLFQGTKDKALQEIDTIYQKENYCIVSYVYGAVMIKHNLLHIQHQTSLTDWQKALLSSHILLPDGIALRTRRYCARLLGQIQGKPTLSNLNGTDFFPALLEHYLTKGWVNLVCYGTYGGNLPTKSGELITAAGEYLLQKYNITRTYWQDIEYTNADMNDRNREAMAQACNPNYPTLMMVCRGVPMQELRSCDHRNKLQHYGIIACNQWATIDYWAGRETRAPRIVRKLRLESLRRLVSDPHKNKSKFRTSFAMIWELALICKKAIKDYLQKTTNSDILKE
jgi:exopolysaccharide biosynthesis WecB/TagA/CpsF family protein